MLGEVGGDGDNSRVNLLSGEVGGRGDETLDEAAGDLRDGHGGCIALRLVLNGESDGVLVGLWVSRCVRVGWIYRLEPGQRISTRFNNPRSYHVLLADEISEVCDSVVLVADKLRLGLVTNVLLPVNVGDDRRDLTI